MTSNIYFKNFDSAQIEIEFSSGYGEVSPYR